MAQSYTRDSNEIITDETILVGNTFVTVDATPTVIFSYPTEEINYKVSVEFGSSVAGTDDVYTGDLLSAYSRFTGSNITKLGTDIAREISSFVGTQPTIYTQANISTQTIEIVVVGTPTDTIAWIVKIDIKHRTL